jgi:hypothetical protein
MSMYVSPGHKGLKYVAERKSPRSQKLVWSAMGEHTGPDERISASRVPIKIRRAAKAYFHELGCSYRV